MCFCMSRRIVSCSLLQAEDGIRDLTVTGVQTCALPILFIEGVDMIRAMDVYTGRILWEASLPGVGAFYNNLAHQPGANASGTNYISTSQGIYVAYRSEERRVGNECRPTRERYQSQVISR